jgi:hypothetical protein
MVGWEWIMAIIGVGTLVLGLNCDYDRRHDLANEYKTIRGVLGHGNHRRISLGFGVCRC